MPPPEAAPGRLAVVVGGGRVDLVSVVVEVSPVQHGVLRSADIDKGRFHTGQHVLHTAQVDVAVDLCGVVGGARNVMLDQGAAFEDGDLGCGRAYVDRHEVAPERPVAAFQVGLVCGTGPVAACPPRRPRPVGCGHCDSGCTPPAPGRRASLRGRRGELGTAGSFGLHRTARTGPGGTRQGLAAARPASRPARALRVITVIEAVGTSILSEHLCGAGASVLAHPALGGRR